MNGKELVAKALETAGRIQSEIRQSDIEDKDRLAGELGKALEGLENIKGKATLRTKNGTNLAFPIGVPVEVDTRSGRVVWSS